MAMSGWLAFLLERGLHSRATGRIGCFESSHRRARQSRVFVGSRVKPESARITGPKGSQHRRTFDKAFGNRANSFAGPFRRNIMRKSTLQFVKSLICCFAVLMTVQIAEAASQTGNQSSVPGAVETSSSSPQQPASSPGSTATASGSAPLSAEDPSGTAGAPAQSQAAGRASSTAIDEPGPIQNNAPTAVGTAAAPAPQVTGVAGARLTGAVIAPAKQRRVRTFLIRVAVVVGACVAIGTVVALSHSSPSQPRMSH